MSSEQSRSEAESEVSPGRSEGLQGPGGGQSARSEIDVGVILCVIGMLVFAIQMYMLWDYIVDDAYIAFVYARNAARGHGFVYNPGERVEGFTGFLWVILLAVGARLAPDIPFLAKVLSLAFGLGVIWLTWRIGRALYPSETWPAGLAVLFLCTCAPFVQSVADCYETSLFGLISLSCVWMMHREWSAGRTPYAAFLLAGLGELCRPDGVLLLPVLLAMSVVGRPDKEWRKTFVRLAPALLLWAAMVGAHLLWRHHYYGYWLPNTYYLKMQNNRSKLVLGLGKLSVFFARRGGFVIGVAVLGYVCLRSGRLVIGLAGLAAVRVFTVLATGGAWMGHHRFLAPAVMPIVLLAVLGGAELLRALTRTSERVKRSTRLIMLAVLILVLLSHCLECASKIHEARTKYLKVLAGARSVGRFLKKAAKPGETAAVWDAGAMAYYSEVPTLDVGGINDIYIAHHAKRAAAPHKNNYPVSLDCARDLDYFFEKKNPTYIVFQVLTRHRKEPFTGLYIESEYRINKDQRFRDNYVTIRTFPAAPPYYYVLSVKKETAERLAAEGLLGG